MEVSVANQVSLVKEAIRTASSIRPRATNHVEMAMCRLLEAAPKLVADDRLRAFDPDTFKDLDAYVMAILLSGSLVQRAGVVDNLDPSCDLAIPELKSLSRDNATELLGSYIRQACNAFGCDFKGDLAYALNMLYDSYGGLTILEWARFINAICKGAYQTDFQSINTRGINLDFLNDWVEQHCENRDSLLRSLKSELPDKPEKDPDNAVTIEQIKVSQAQYAQFTASINQRRRDWESSLIETKMEVAREIRKDKEGRDVEFVYEIPVQRDRPEAAYKRLYALLEVFYFFGEEGAKEKIANLMGTWELLRVIEYADVDQKDFYRSQASALYKNLVRLVRPQPATDYLLSCMYKLADEKPLSDFHKAITGKDYDGASPHLPAEDYVNAYMSAVTKQFRNEYVKSMTDAHPDFFPLYQDEYFGLCCIQYAVRVLKMAHPFFHYID